jgi:cell wall-associated NlpC family hydrolase
MVRIVSVRMLFLCVALVGCLVLAPAANAAGRSVTTTPAQRAAAMRIAISKVGAPYASGAAGPRRFDCSGLVTFAFRGAGHPLAGRSSFELVRTGARIRRAALRPGDLVFTWDRAFGHVGVYIGRGRYVHAPRPGRRVEIAPLPRGSAFVAAIRP